MPRNSSGTYSLPAGNPVVTGTTISSVWANTTLSDLGTAMTDSLSRSGDGGMLAPLELDAGLIGAPGLSWGAETTSGLYRAGAGDFRYSIAAADVFGLTANGALVANGAVGTPSLSFLSDTDSGLYRIGANNIGVAVGGVKIIDVASTGVTITGGFGFTGQLLGGDGTVGAPAFSFTSDTDSGIYLISAGNVGISVGGSQAIRFQSDLNTVFAGIGYFPSGAAAAPSISFGADSNTGMFLSSADVLGFAAGGVRTVAVTLSGLTVTSNAAVNTASGPLSLGVDTGTGYTWIQSFASLPLHLNPLGNQVLIVDGTAAAPQFSWFGDTDTGIYRPAANEVGFAAAGNQRFVVGSGACYTIGVPHLFNDGAVGAPGLAFQSDPDTGLFRFSSGVIRVALNGAASFIFDNVNYNETVVPLAIPNGAVNKPGLLFSSDSDTGMYYSSGIVFAVGSANALILDSALNARFVDGTAGTPSVTFQSDPDTGIYNFGANAIGFSTGGSARIVISSSFFNFSGSAQAVAPDGSASLPSYSFVNDQNTGFYSLSADHIGITTNGATLGAFAGGSFTGTLTGMTTTVQGTLNWFRYGNMVVIYGQALQGTSNSTAMTLTGLPAAIQTGSTSRCMPVSLVNNSVNSIGGATVSGGTVTFGNGTSFDPAGFTSSNTKGMAQGIYVVYFLAGS